MVMAPQKKSWVSTTTYKDRSWIPGLESTGFARCRCSHCASVRTDTAHWTSLRKPLLKSTVRIGDRVTVKRGGEEVKERSEKGVVKYVGDLDSQHTNDPVFIGVKLDAPVGEHDGLYRGKRFFSCSQGHGLIIPSSNVHLSLPSNPRKKKLRSASPLERPHSGSWEKTKLGTLLNKSWARSRITVSSAEMVQDSAAGSQKQSPYLEHSNNSNGLTKTPSDGIILEDVEENGSVCEGGGVIDTLPAGASDTDFPSTTVNVSGSSGPDGGSEGRDKSGTLWEKISSKYTLSQFSGLSGAISSHSISSQSEQEEEFGTPEIVSEIINPSSSAIRVSNETPPETHCELQEKKQVEEEKERKEELIDSPSSAKSTSTDNLSKISNSEMEGGTEDEEDEMVIPPAPPGTAASNFCFNRATLVLEQLTNNSTKVMSRLPPSPSHGYNDTLGAGTPTTDVSLEDATTHQPDNCERKKRVISATYDKLTKALKRGIREVHWQRKIHEIEGSGYYTAESRRLHALRSNISQNRQAVAIVKNESHSLRKLQGNKLAAVTSVQAKLEFEHSKGEETHKKIMSYPSSVSIKIKNIKKKAQKVWKKNNP